MKSRLQGARAVAQVSGISTPKHICLSCQRSSLRRQYASAAAAAVPEEHTHNSDSSDSSVQPAAEASGPRPIYQLKAGVVLSRPPVITRDLHPFESAYFLYQRRLNERLALPFTRYFYYKKGTPLDLEWKRKMKERNTPARDIGLYNAYGREGWNDELLVGAPESDHQHQVEALLKDAEPPAPSGAEGSVEALAEQAAVKRDPIERPMSRITEADEKGDLTSLNRLLQRSLYLLVRDKQGRWAFPTATLQQRENLSTAAERIITETGGVNMNTWVVGNVPIGHYVAEYRAPAQDSEAGTVSLGEKTFFLKGRIMTGQARIEDNKLGLAEFRWLAKEEIQKLVTPRYWSMTEDMLTER